jgi:polyvinyl alcohol dehydrogenase (cytochrome)
MSVDGSAENFFDAFVSLDLNTGAVKWATSVIPFDAWNVACFFQGPNCPENAGPDYDFGQGPALFTVSSNGKKRELIGAGQKSGIYWALNPDNGAIVWNTQVGPGSTLGGLQWGSAVDEKRIYTAVSNFYYIPHAMTKGPGNGTTVYGGFWAALDAATGEIIWENAGSNPPATGGFPGAIAFNTGMVSVANGVVFAGAMDAVGTMYAFEASTGKKLWSFESGGSVNSGPAIVDGTVYWGSGYTNFGLGTGNNKLYAFKLGNTKNRTSPATETIVKNIESAAGWAFVAPNPIEKGKINLTISGEYGHLVIWKLVNLHGAQLASGKFNAAGNNHKQELDLNSLAAGNYFIMVQCEQKTTTIRVI